MSLSLPELRGPIACDNDSEAHALITVAAGEVLVMALAHNAPRRIVSVTWNGEDWTRIGAAPTAHGLLSLWMLRASGDGTANVSVEMDADVRALCGRIYALPGTMFAGRGPLDVTASSYGCGESPDSGVTPQTVQAAEVILGAVMTDGGLAVADDPVGAWADGMDSSPLDYATNGAVGYGVTCAVGYRIVAAQGQYRAAQSLAAGRDWAAIVAAFREEFALDQKPSIVPFPVEHRPSAVTVENPVRAFPTEHPRAAVKVKP